MEMELGYYHFGGIVIPFGYQREQKDRPVRDWLRSVNNC
jgi:hypothetical protein